MIKRVLVLALVVTLASVFFPLFAGISDRDDMGRLATAYLTDGPEALSAANLVTSVVVTYRGLDTLGEVTVLFAASAGVSLVFARIGRGAATGGKAGGDATGSGNAHGGADAATDDRSRRKDRTRRQPPSELVETGVGLLLPLILLFGIYIFVNGHLTPGGGFQGGVVIASGVLLAFLGGTITGVPHGVLSALEMLAGAGYVAVGLLGLWLAAGFLDPRFLPGGEIGSLFSAGAIPVIYSLIGIKVGAELSGVIDAMHERSRS